MISSSTCTNPMNTFTQSPFSLTEGQSILIKLRALNELDYGPYGSPSSNLAVIIVVPHTPTSGPVRVNDSTSPTQVTVTMPEVATDLDGDHRFSHIPSNGTKALEQYLLIWLVFQAIL